MKKLVPSLLFIVAMIVLVTMLVFDNNTQTQDAGAVELKAKVISVDDSEVISSGISSIGYQDLVVQIIEGKYKDQQIEAKNPLMGKLDYDNFLKPGDKIILAIYEENNVITNAKAVDIYRQDWHIILFLTFVLCLVLYSGYVGIKALFSFVASLYIIWKFLIPGLLQGKDPIVLAIFVLIILTAVIDFSVAGFTKKGFSAFCGTIFGLIATTGITMFFTGKFQLLGMTAPYSETLLYSGHLDLDMKGIFNAAVIIGASGAAMDIAMDVAASMEELRIKRPDMKMKELIQSGFNIGRAVIGTMTTTLLLAYSGGYLTLLMLFMTLDSSFARILNLKIVTAEILRTLAGSIGLVMVAPLTAIVGGWIFTTDFGPVFGQKSDSLKNNQIPDTGECCIDNKSE